MSFYYLSWSGGKDSALALNRIIKTSSLPVKLFTNVTKEYDRISMHGVRKELLHKQAEAAGLHLEIIEIPKICTNIEYAEIMNAFTDNAIDEGCAGMIFGDIFLESVKKYREENLSKKGMQTFFPLWGLKSTDILDEFINEGFQAVITCVDTQQISADFSGMTYGRSFAEKLPATADICGENGEFHSFVYNAPFFSNPLAITIGEKTLRDNRFSYTDILPG